MSETKLSHSEQQAVAQMESILEMVAALECDYERLEELRDERDDMAGAIERADLPSDKCMCTIVLADWDEANGEELAELKAAAGECSDREQAEQRIQEDALSVQVRSDWHDVGETEEDAWKDGEFCILLCTGGPACRIIGELRGGEPHSARLEHQDWGTPWTEHIVTGTDHDALLTYCRCFFYGE